MANIRFKPKLIQNVSLTLGISDEEYLVLKNCSDGDNTIEDIVILTKLNWNDVVKILKKYEKKGWIKIDYEGDGEPEYQPISIKKFPETAVRLGMISKKKYDINILCDGERTVSEIAKEVGLSSEETLKILREMEKNKIVEIYPKIPLKEEVISEKIEEKEGKKLLQPVCIKNVILFTEIDENTKKILQLCDGEKTIEDIYVITHLPFSDILKTIIEYEEKGWITLKIDQYTMLVELKNKIKDISDENLIIKEYEKLFGKLKEIKEVEEILSKGILGDETSRDFLKIRLKSELPKLPTPVLEIILDKIFLLPTAEERGILVNKILASESVKKFKFTSEIPSSIVKTTFAPTPVPTPISTPASSTPVHTSTPAQVSSPPISNIPAQPIETQTQAAPIPIEEETMDQKLDMILNIIDNFNSQILNSIISLVDVEGDGTILYQTSEWNVQKDLSKFIFDWQASASSIIIGGIKYATIKVIPNDIFIATNVQGYGHILAKYINPLTVLLVKMPKEQDPLDVEDQLPIIIDKINRVFST